MKQLKNILKVVFLSSFVFASSVQAWIVKLTDQELEQVNREIRRRYPSGATQRERNAVFREARNRKKQQRIIQDLMQKQQYWLDGVNKKRRSLGTPDGRTFFTDSNHAIHNNLLAGVSSVRKSKNHIGLMPNTSGWDSFATEDFENQRQLTVSSRKRTQPNFVVGSNRGEGSNNSINFNELSVALGKLFGTNTSKNGLVASNSGSNHINKIGFSAEFANGDVRGISLDGNLSEMRNGVFELLKLMFGGTELFDSYNENEEGEEDQLYIEMARAAELSLQSINESEVLNIDPESEVLDEVPNIDSESEVFEAKQNKTLKTKMKLQAKKKSKARFSGKLLLNTTGWNSFGDSQQNLQKNIDFDEEEAFVSPKIDLTLQSNKNKSNKKFSGKIPDTTGWNQIEERKRFFKRVIDDIKQELQKTNVNLKSVKKKLGVLLELLKTNLKGYMLIDFTSVLALLARAVYSTNPTFNIARFAASLVMISARYVSRGLSSETSRVEQLAQTLMALL